MKQFLGLVLILAVCYAIYYFVHDARNDILDPELQQQCNEEKALGHFTTDREYQDCLKNK